MSTFYFLNYKKWFILTILLIIVGFSFFLSSSALATEETRTITTFIGQDTGERTISAQYNQAFSFVMTDEIVDIKNAFFEITGISNANSAQIIKTALDDTSLTSPTTYTLDATGGPTPFKIIYNVTNKFSSSGNNCYIATRGTYNCTFSFKADTVSVFNLSVKLITTYRFVPPTGGGSIPTSGTYISPVYDSKQSYDDAGGLISRSGWNTIRWIEDISNATLVKSITIAANNDDNATWNYFGGDGTSNETTCESSNTCYAQSNSTQTVDKRYCTSTSLGADRYEIFCRIAPDQQNFRYFRYKIKLCSEKAPQCSADNRGSYSPKVEKVILNWSP